MMASGGLVMIHNARFGTIFISTGLYSTNSPAGNYVEFVHVLLLRCSFEKQVLHDLKFSTRL
jgi:hypothetical protein